MLAESLVSSPPRYGGNALLLPLSPPLSGNALLLPLSPLRGNAALLPLSPLWGEMPKAEGGRERSSPRLRPHPLRHRRDPPLSLRDISPQRGES